MTLKSLASAALAASLMLGCTFSAAAQDVLRLRMNGDINSVDPIATTNFTIRNSAYLIYDTLFSLDADFQVQPQMAEGVTLSDDNLTYTITLREGLTFHDGAPVTAADAVASLQRWGKVDGLGKILFSKAESLTATDDRTLVLQMKEPWGQVLPALGKISSNVPFIMPARLAANEPTVPVTEAIGSGPFRMIAEEWVPGSVAVYEKFEEYVPRSEPASMAAGGKIANFDRIEIRYIPDSSQAVDALLNGEIDWIEDVAADMIPLFEGSDTAYIFANPQGGNSLQLVVNHLNPPFDNPKVREALQWALEPTPFMQAIFGDQTQLYQICAAIFFCGSPFESTVNTDRILTRDVEKAKALLAEAGYEGTPVLLPHVTDIPFHDHAYSVLKPMLEEAGFVVDEQMTDWASVSTRRASREPVANGGWNLFFTGWGYVDQSNPMTNVYVAGAGLDGWFGWADSAELRDLRARFAETSDPAEQKALAETMQSVAYDLVPFVPLGQAALAQGVASNLEGFIESPVPFFWNVKRKQ
ncbi:peptide/nickel transport system substrate-binding protein [Devosia enhydra]|uniref:Peptide/nickel transport system substrate-binding protein n=1 Tax=Devosia enhydra TaxID=665118 RepID=A0A1K2I1C4_9HYPH|nr:ABC transporter substrate-binding protein [Devosia enhydra]SFZ86019.1 peptide/nickel transport system substrate-binding protein [Devosia enhydra]